MLKLRGGLESIESAVYIRMSLFWIELNFCAARDTVPKFPPPFHLIKNPYSAAHITCGLQHRDKSVEISGISSRLLSIEMLEIFTQLSYLTVALTGQSPLRIQWDNDNFPGFGFYTTLHKLLTTQLTNEDKFGDAVQEMCRLGAIFFLAEVRRKFGIAPVLTDVQSTKLHNLLDVHKTLWVKELDHMRLWTIMMAGCCAETEAGRTWAANALLRSKMSLMYPEWDELMDIASNMWWIDEIFWLRSRDLQSEYIKLSTIA